jgi:hypothetical protein
LSNLPAEKYFGRAKKEPCYDSAIDPISLHKPNTMNKIICILAGAALLAACEQKTETAAPTPEATSPPAAETTAAPAAPETSPSPATTP